MHAIAITFVVGFWTGSFHADFHLDSVTNFLCDLKQVISPFWVSSSLSTKLKAHSSSHILESILLGKTAFKQSPPALLPAPPHFSPTPAPVWRCHQHPCISRWKVGTVSDLVWKATISQMENTSVGFFPEDAFSQIVQILAWPLTNCLTSLSPRFLFCKVGIIVTAVSYSYCEE